MNTSDLNYILPNIGKLKASLLDKGCELKSITINAGKPPILEEPITECMMYGVVINIEYTN